MVIFSIFQSWIHLFAFVNMVLLDCQSVFVTDRLRQYRLEDFFWTGSKDGPFPANKFENETSDNEEDLNEASFRTTAIFRTTTILYATVYPDTALCSDGCTPKVSAIWTESHELSSAGEDIIPTIEPITPISSDPHTQGYEQARTSIQPTPVWTSTTTGKVLPVPDQRYWLLTVLQLDNPSSLKTDSTEANLAALYRKAFFRQRRYDRIPVVDVQIHNSTRFQDTNPDNIALIYTVSVGGEYVLAQVAANDMQLLTQTEVNAELGLPVLIKAEPYLKNVGDIGARVKGRSRDTWLLIGSIVAGITLLIGLAAIFAISLSKNRVQRNAREISNKKQVFDEEKGEVNPAFENNDTKKVAKSPRLKSEGVKFNEEHLDSTSSSGSSNSSEASLVRLRQQQRKLKGKIIVDETLPMPKPRTKIRHFKDSGLSRVDIGEIHSDGLEEIDSNIPTPHSVQTSPSYLSMPSVKAFPRGARIPEPLNRVLEPVSIRDFDNETPRYPFTGDFKDGRAPRIARHGSLEEDPGVIGPVVWDRHCREMNDFNKYELDMMTNSGRVRKRFSELLDDAFSLISWGRNGRPEHENDEILNLPTTDRARSAVLNQTVNERNDVLNRPKTTGNSRPKTSGVHRPRRAWNTPNFFSRTSSTSNTIGQSQSVMDLHSNFSIDPALVVVDGELSPRDPAVHLIAAIKTELRKFRPDDAL